MACIIPSYVPKHPFKTTELFIRVKNIYFTLIYGYEWKKKLKKEKIVNLRNLRLVLDRDISKTAQRGYLFTAIHPARKKSAHLAVDAMKSICV